MEGFGVHTFRFINEEGHAHFVKFHWKPKLGVHSVAWDEATKISGKDPDFHRRDLWEAIENGAFPEWELGIQVVAEEDEHKFPFDLLDPTKLIPEELVPVQLVGKMVLDRNPDNFFAETEQVAFHPGHLVPGIDFTNDPLLQGRLFSYTDTQLSRLGSPNFHEIPINRSVPTVHNNQRDGHMRQLINTSRTSYEPNSISQGDPKQAKISDGGFATYAERIDAKKIRARSKSFMDHFSQATLFYNSQSEAEKNHIVDAFSFELGKVEIPEIRERMVGILTLVDGTLASRIAENLGMPVPSKPEEPINRSIPADADPADYQPVKVDLDIKMSTALSMENTVKNTIATRQIAILAADGVDLAALNEMKDALIAEGAVAKIIAPKLGNIKGAGDKMVKVDMSFLTATSVVFDAVYVPGGKECAKTLMDHADAIHFINEAYRHCKTIGAEGEGIDVLKASYIGKNFPVTPLEMEQQSAEGIILIFRDGEGANKERGFINAVAQHRFWERELKSKVPA
jgi:catalase